MDFFQPKTVEEAKKMLSEYSGAKLLAGGTDLVLGLRREDEKTQYLIDISRVSELKSILEDEESIILGSMVTFNQLKENCLIKSNFRSLFECAKNMGSPQIRNTATIGGNIANAGSAADAIPCVLSLNGVLVIESSRGSREVGCEEYFKSFKEQRIREDEILTRIIIPKKYNKSGYYKLGKRNSLAIARVSVALGMKVKDEIIEEFSLSLGAVGRLSFKVSEFENAANGKNISWLSGEEALGIIENAVYESIKGRKTMPFKKEAVKGVYKEALRVALEQ